MRAVPALFAAGGLALAGSSGFLASQAFSAANQAAPTRTVTVDVGTGEQGPPGPPGPKGDPGPPGSPGGVQCIAGYEPAVVVINGKGGHATIYTCLQN